MSVKNKKKRHSGGKWPEIQIKKPMLHVIRKDFLLMNDNFDYVAGLKTCEASFIVKIN